MSSPPLLDVAVAVTDTAPLLEGASAVVTTEEDVGGARSSSLNCTVAGFLPPTSTTNCGLTAVAPPCGARAALNVLLVTSTSAFRVLFTAEPWPPFAVESWNTDNPPPPPFTDFCVVRGCCTAFSSVMILNGVVVSMIVEGFGRSQDVWMC